MASSRSLVNPTANPALELSMGMSQNFEMAIEEGADWVRVGTALFGERPLSSQISRIGWEREGEVVVVIASVDAGQGQPILDAFARDRYGARKQI